MNQLNRRPLQISGLERDIASCSEGFEKVKGHGERFLSLLLRIKPAGDLDYNLYEMSRSDMLHLITAT